jgi:hypothetical protein
MIDDPARVIEDLSLLGQRLESLTQQAKTYTGYQKMFGVSPAPYWLFYIDNSHKIGYRTRTVMMKSRVICIIDLTCVYVRINFRVVAISIILSLTPFLSIYLMSACLPACLPVCLSCQVLAFDHSELETASDRFEATLKLWGAVKSWTEKKTAWMESKFRGLHVDVVAKEIDEYSKIR